jgi:hypothetical protein
MAAWQASGTLLGSTGADISPVWPTHLTNDIGILIATSRVQTDTLLTPANYTLLHGPINSTAWRGYVFYKRATSAAEGNPLLDWTGTGEKYGQVHTVRGAIGTGNPFADSLLAGDVTDPITHAGITPTVANQLVIVVGIGSDNASASVTVTCANAPTAFTQRSFTTIATGADATGSFHDQTRTNTTATGTITLDHNSTMPAEMVFVAAILDPDSALNTSLLRRTKRFQKQAVSRGATW